jgi:undecaprenyl phosphate N,N'-diacetylbacillosamine 1-phosphate transferase
MYTGKRMLDLATSLVLFIPLSPLFILIAILIKLTSEGPVLYIQKRAGLNGKVFDIYKFRTMVTDADKNMPVLYAKINGDSRVTKIGRLLRKLSLDELPQLVNIMKGDMSLVGPRPFVMIENDGLSEYQKSRLYVLPGVTGLAQINGRSDLPIDTLISFDLDYVNRCSFLLDLYILIKTIPYVLFGKGAY